MPDNSRWARFDGHDPTAFLNDCFDLSDYMGTTVELAVTFGSDCSITYPGWYIASIVAGGPVTAIDDSNWSTIKSLYWDAVRLYSGNYKEPQVTLRPHLAVWP